MSAPQAVIKINAGSVGSAAANAAYITREEARAPDGGLVTHNAPDTVAQVEGSGTPEGWSEARMRLQTWAERREAEEVARHGNRKGQPRTHYRVMMSYEEKMPTEEAQADASEWLEEQFPGARAAAVVHQDTENTHVHVWMSPRLKDGSKINISRQDFRDLTSEWDRIYTDRMVKRGRANFYEAEMQDGLTEKMEEARRFKQRWAERRGRGASGAKLEAYAERRRPERARPPGPEVYRRRDRRRIGGEVAEGASRVVGESLEQRQEEAQAAVQEARERIEQAEVLHEDEESHERASEKELEADERHEKRARGDQSRSDEGSEAPERGERASGAGGQGGPGGGSESEQKKDRGGSGKGGQQRGDGGISRW